jgi:hypothetical protein
MLARLPAPRTGRALLPRNIIFLLVHRVGNLAANCLDNVEASTYHNPTYLHGLLRGQLYSFYIFKDEHISYCACITAGLSAAERSARGTALNCTRTCCDPVPCRPKEISPCSHLPYPSSHPSEGHLAHPHLDGLH